MKEIICLYGLPASGKTTQAKKVSDNLGFQQFGMGDRLRSEIDSGSKLGAEIKNYVDQGILIPDEIMEQVIKNTNVQSENRGIVFDGFPRIVSQARMLDKIIKDSGFKLVGFFYLKVGVDTAVNRITARAQIDHRPDDEDPRVVKNRLDVFAEESVPLIEYYKNIDALIEIDGEQSIEEVYKKIENNI